MAYRPEDLSTDVSGIPFLDKILEKPVDPMYLQRHFEYALGRARDICTGDTEIDPADHPPGKYTFSPARTYYGGNLGFSGSLRVYVRQGDEGTGACGVGLSFESPAFTGSAIELTEVGLRSGIEGVNFNLFLTEGLEAFFQGLKAYDGRNIWIN